MTRQLHLNLFIHSRGHHEASWRHPASSPLALTDIRYYQDPEQHQFRGELYPWQARNERKPDAGDDQKDRGSGVEPPCHNGHDDKYRDQQQKRLDRCRHRSHCLAKALFI